MGTNRIAVALQRIEAEERALLELSYWRVVPDEEIAGLLRVDAHYVRRRHEGMEALCTELRLEGAERRRELVEALRSMPDEGWQVEPAVAERSGGPERRGPRGKALLGALVVVIAAATIAAVLAGGDDGGSAAHPKEDARAVGAPRHPAAPAGSPRTGLQAVARGPGEGTAQLVGDGSTRRLLLDVRGLPRPGRGAYVVWLYNNVADARSIGGSQRGSFRLDARLPDDASRFRVIDISLEAPDGIRAHGGDSVLRVPLRVR